jgi:predicted nucleotidyltransferase
MYEQADRVIACYDDLDGVSMVLLTGSVARGLSDDASDLDLYLYCDDVDRASLETTPRVEQLGGRRVVGVDGATGYFEKYWLDDRFVDVEVVSNVVLDVADEAVTSGAATDQVLGLACSLRDAVARRGGDELARWQGRLVYGDELARHQVQTRGVRLLAPSVLHRLSYLRGDTLSYEVRLSAVLLDVVGLLGAVNRAFLPLAEPKWLPWHLERLDHRPPDLLARLDAGLTRPDAATVADLDRLVHEVLDLVDEHVPDASTAPARFVLALDPSRPPG